MNWGLGGSDGGSLPMVWDHGWDGDRDWKSNGIGGHRPDGIDRRVLPLTLPFLGDRT